MMYFINHESGTSAEIAVDGVSFTTNGWWYESIDDMLRAWLHGLYGSAIYVVEGGNAKRIYLAWQLGKDDIERNIWKSKLASGYAASLSGNRVYLTESLSASLPFGRMSTEVLTTSSSRVGKKAIRAKGFYVQENRGERFFVIVGDAQERHTRRLKLDPGEVTWIKVNGIKVYG